MNTPLALVDRAAFNPRQLAAETLRESGLLSDLITGLSAEKAPTRFSCAKALLLLSEERPELLYPHFDFFASRLRHPNKIFQWNASLVLANLAGIDVEDRFAAFFDQYFSPIPGPVMITAATAIKGGARIARAKPLLADRIATELLKVAKARYATPECRNIAIGHALSALGEFLHLLRDPAPTLQFARRQLQNSRPATRKKAELLLRRARKS